MLIRPARDIVVKRIAMECPKCGTIIQVASPYCPKCGVELASYDPRADPSVCSKCHFHNEPGVVFYSRCGSKLGAPDDSEMVDITHWGSEPYLWHKGWPFAAFSEVTQTYAQFRSSAIIAAIFFGFIVLLLVIGGEPAAALAIAATVSVASFLAWRVGRLGAEGVFSEDIVSDDSSQLSSPEDQLKMRRA